MLVVVEDSVGVKAVNMRNHERPPILSTMAGEPLTNCGIGRVSISGILQLLHPLACLITEPVHTRVFTGKEKEFDNASMLISG